MVADHINVYIINKRYVKPESQKKCKCVKITTTGKNWFFLFDFQHNRDEGLHFRNACYLQSLVYHWYPLCTFWMFQYKLSREEVCKSSCPPSCFCIHKALQYVHFQSSSISDLGSGPNSTKWVLELDRVLSPSTVGLCKYFICSVIVYFCYKTEWIGCFGTEICSSLQEWPNILAEYFWPWKHSCCTCMGWWPSVRMTTLSWEV